MLPTAADRKRLRDRLRRPAYAIPLYFFNEEELLDLANRAVELADGDARMGNIADAMAEELADRGKDVRQTRDGRYVVR